MPSDNSLRGKAVVRHGPPQFERGGRNSGGGNDAPLGVPPIRGGPGLSFFPRPPWLYPRRIGVRTLATSRTGTTKWKALRAKAIAEALANDQYTCPRCGVALDYSRSQQPNSPEPDHIQEHANGGKDSLDNIRIICRRCNQQLGGKLGGKRAQERIKTLRIAQPIKLKTKGKW